MYDWRWKCGFFVCDSVWRHVIASEKCTHPRPLFGHARQNTSRMVFVQRMVHARRFVSCHSLGGSAFLRLEGNCTKSLFTLDENFPLRKKFLNIFFKWAFLREWVKVCARNPRKQGISDKNTSMNYFSRIIYTHTNCICLGWTELVVQEVKRQLFPLYDEWKLINKRKEKLIEKYK